MKLKKEIFIIIAIFILLLSMILPDNLGDLDELWNYNFARNILDGKLAYQDFNMLQTPLLPLASSMFLKIFGNELLVMRMLAVILCTAIFFLEYKILKRLNVNSYVSLIFTLFTMYLFQEHVRIDYNFAVLLIILILLYIELKPKEKIIENNTKKDLIIGILAGCTFLFKQTTGLAVIAVTVGYKLLVVSNKDEFKIWLKIAIFRLLGAIIPIIILFICMQAFGITEEFINYTILGATTFSNSIPYKNLLKNESIIIKILSVMLPIILIIQYIFGVAKNDNSKTNKTFLTLFAYSVASCIVIFPISDEIHFLIGITPCLITLYLLIYKLFTKILKGKIKIFLKYFIECASIGALILYIILSVNPLKEYIENISKYNQLEHFKYIPVSDGLKDQIKQLDEYIKTSEKEVYILDATACIYKIPINQYYKDYDMFLKGNLGIKGEEGIIEDLNQKENIKILIMKEGLSRNWQNPEKVREYIMQNYKQTGEIACFAIYEK